MNWLFRRYMKKLLKDYESAYRFRYEHTQDETMRPDVYWLQKYLNKEY